jgi:TM2 domain-containing membrane protein YozV
MDVSEADVNSRYAAARMFFVVAAVFAIAGAARFHHSEIGAGLAGEDLLNPLFWITIPRLVPFAAALLSACFGLAYFLIEKKFRRPLSVSLAGVQVVSYVLAVLGHAAMVNFWWRALNEPPPSNAPLPMWASFLELGGIAMCCLVFALNIFWSASKARPVTANPT